MVNSLRGVGKSNGGLIRLAEALHLKHSLHDKLVLALLVRVTLVLALPWKIELRLPALVERDQKVSALVSVTQRHSRLHHLLLRRYHLLRRSLRQIAHDFSLSLSLLRSRFWGFIFPGCGAYVLGFVLYGPPLLLISRVGSFPFPLLGLLFFCIFREV